MHGAQFFFFLANCENDVIAQSHINLVHSYRLAILLILKKTKTKNGGERGLAPFSEIGAKTSAHALGQQDDLVSQYNNLLKSPGGHINKEG